MKLLATELIDAPRPFVFARAAELNRFARVAEARGAQVVRHPRDTDTGRGLRFDIAYTLRGTPLAAEVELVRRVPPDALGLAVLSALVSGRVDALFETVPAGRTRLQLEVELTPLTVKGRMLLGSLKLLQGRIQDRLDHDIAAAARATERLWRAEQAGERGPRPGARRRGGGA